MKKISEFLSENFHFLVVKFTIYLNRRVLSENFHFLVVKFTIYLNRRVFVMRERVVLRDCDISWVSLLIYLFCFACHRRTANSCQNKQSLKFVFVWFSQLQQTSRKVLI